MSWPVAATAEAALSAPEGMAAREREARALAHGVVRFVTDLVGPAFSSREAAREAYAAHADAPWCELRPLTPEGAAPPPPVSPTNREGVRWPAAAPGAPCRWRLAVTYWRTGEDATAADAMELEAARRLRRDAASAHGLDARTLRRLTDQPLRPVKLQQPLDIGLFEVRLPERPDLVVPDE